MTGPEHYREAEEALRASTWQRQRWGELADGSDESAAALDAAAWEMRRAQVHATLALAAATAMNDSSGGMSVPDWDAWRSAASLSKPRERES